MAGFEAEPAFSLFPVLALAGVGDGCGGWGCVAPFSVVVWLSLCRHGLSGILLPELEGMRRRCDSDGILLQIDGLGGTPGTAADS